MKVFGQRSEIPGGLRSARRRHVALGARAIATDMEKTALISDLSTRGARLSGSGLPAQDASINLVVGEMMVSSRVAWSIGSRCGVEFEQVLEPQEVERMKWHGRVAVV